MDEHEAGAAADQPDSQRAPLMQEIFDNLWLLFLVSMAIVLISYLAWGLIDLVNVPRLP